jgi:hypothetical protein
MIIPETLKDPLASQIFFHLLYSGPRTNKQLRDDFSILRLETKRGVIVRGRTGYNYVRNITGEMADNGILKAKRHDGEFVYSVDLEGFLSKLLFDIRDTAGLGYAHQSLKYVPEYFHTFFEHKITQRLLKDGIGEFNNAFDLEENEARHQLFNYKVMLEHTSRKVKTGLLLFLVRLCERITEMPYDRMWWDMVKKGSGKFRQEVVEDINSYNLNSLPADMKKDVSEEKMKLYINRYLNTAGAIVVESLVSYWLSKSKIEKKNTENFLPYVYLMQRIFIYLLYTVFSEGFYERMLRFEFPVRAVQLHPEHRDAIERIGMKRAVDVLRKVNSYLIVKKKKTLPDDVRRAIIYESDLYPTNSFIELITMRYRDKTAEKLAEQNAFLRSMGKKETRVLTLNNAISIAMSEGKTMDVIDIVHLLHIVLINKGPSVMQKLRKLQGVLEKSHGYKSYFEKLNEMYQIKLPEK